MIHDFTVTDIHAGDGLHVFIAQREVPDIEVLFHALPVRGFGNDHDPALHIPAQRDLGRAFAVFFANARQHGICEDAVFAFGEGAPGFRTHSVFLHESESFGLLEEGMQFNLVDSRNDLHGLAEVSGRCG